MIHISGLRHGILDIPSCRIPAGHVAVIGPNGSGKSTLLRLLAGMEEPVQGCIRIGEKSPGDMAIGWVHEVPGRNSLFLRVDEELASPLRFRHYQCEEISRRTREVAERAGISHLMDRDLVTLSGGEQVLIAMATAIISGPEILILDEWDSHLDAHTAAALQEQLSGLGVRCIVQCTQNMDLAATADTVILLSRGRVKAGGPPREVCGKCADSCWYPPSWRWREWNLPSRG